MKLTTFAIKGEQRLGAMVGNNKIVAALAAAEKPAARREKRSANTFYSDMITFLNAGTKAMSAARKLVKAVDEKLGDEPKADTKSTHYLTKVRLKAPVPNPAKLFCLAGNYKDHIEEGGGRMTAQDRETPRVFMKPPSTTVIGQDEDILIPPIARAIDWEGELAVVIGRKGKGIASKDAMKHVAGYTIMNDVSERQLQIKPRQMRSRTPRISTSAPSSTACASSTTTRARCSTSWPTSSSISLPSSPSSRATSSAPERSPVSAPQRAPSSSRVTGSRSRFPRSVY